MQETKLIISATDFVHLMAIEPPDDLRDELERAIVVPDDSMQSDIVTMGSRVLYAETGTGSSREVQIVYPDEAAPAQGRVSVFAPVGAALIGLSVGQEIDWDFPGGGSRRLIVMGVTQPGGTGAGTGTGHKTPTH